MVRKTLTEIKNDIMSTLINDNDLVKSLVISQDNFLNNSNISDEEKYLIEHPKELIRQLIFPYKKMPNAENKSKITISMTFTDFEPQGSYRNGYVNFFILCPYEYEKTIYGIRYDWIADKLESLLAKSGLCTFEYSNRSDVNVNDDYLGHVITFKILDFWLVR